MKLLQNPSLAPQQRGTKQNAHRKTWTHDEQLPTVQQSKETTLVHVLHQDWPHSPQLIFRPDTTPEHKRVYIDVSTANC